MQQDTSAHTPRRLRTALLAPLLCLAALSPALAAGALDRAKESGKLTFGFAGDMRPLAFADASGKASGYAVEVCAKVADALKNDLKLPALNTEFVALPLQESVRAVEQGKVDLLCGAVPTLERRAAVDFSVPIMLSGTSVVVGNAAPVRLVHVLSGLVPVGPAWRGSPDQAPQRVLVAVIGDTALEKTLAATLRERRILVETVSVKDTATGLQLLKEGKAHAFFADRAQLLDAVARGGLPSFNVLDRTFRRDIVALAMHRNDDDFRLAVDRALSRLYRSEEMNAIYSKYFGPPTPSTLDFFQLVALPD